MQCSSGRFLHTQWVHIHHNKIELTVQVYLTYSAGCFPIHVKLEWFLYTMRMMVLTSYTLLCPSGSTLVNLNIQFYIIVSAQTGDAHNVSTWVL